VTLSGETSVLLAGRSVVAEALLSLKVVNVLAPVAALPVPLGAMAVPLLPPGTGNGALLLSPVLAVAVTVIVEVAPFWSVVA
jgi:hypothetical protein